MALIEKLTTIADAIREKTGSSDKLTLDQMAEAVKDFSSDGLPSVIEPGDYPVLASEVTYALSTYGTNAYRNAGMYIVIPRNGTYRFKYEATAPNGSWTVGTALYKNNVSVYTNTTWEGGESSRIGRRYQSNAVD